MALVNAFGLLGRNVEGIWYTISAQGPKTFTKRTQFMGTSFMKVLTSLKEITFLNSLHNKEPRYIRETFLDDG